MTNGLRTAPTEYCENESINATLIMHGIDNGFRDICLRVIMFANWLR